MADETAVVDQIVETPPSAAAEPVDLSAQPLDKELERVEAVAEQFLAAQEEAKKPAGPVRGPDGKFVSTKPAEPQNTVEKPEEPVETPVVGETTPEPPKPTLDPIWAEAARLEGFSQDEIARFKDEQDVQHNIAVKRYAALQRAGITPDDYNAFRQWKQQGSTAQGQQPVVKPDQSAPVVPAKPFALKLDENEFTPEQIKSLRESLEPSVNEVLTENQKLRQEVAQAKTTFEQRVQAAEQAAKQAASEAQAAAEWDAAAKATPGFVEVMGLPSEVHKLGTINPNDPKVQNYKAYAAYFAPIYERYASILGPDRVALSRVMADAFAASPFAKLVPTNGTNGTSGKSNQTNPQYGNGSVVRAAPRKGSNAEPAPVGGDLAAEMARVAANLDQAWQRNGVNPFSTVGS